MKKLIVLLTLLVASVSFAQNKNEKGSLQVDGVCVMCKERIEKAAIKTKGVKSAIWNVQTHELKVIFDARKTNLDSIEKKVVAVGHDTPKVKATEDAYNALHPCCYYRDDAVKDDHKDE